MKRIENTMKTEKEKRKALEKFIIDNKNLEELEQKISRFNIFESVGMVRQEIKHSNFIQFLLSPAEKHRLGDLFLRKLLVRVLRESEDPPLDTLEIVISSFNDAEVRREWKNIDLLVYSPSNHFVCIIENKVDSSEGLDQLNKYELVIEKEFSDCHKVFIFLTKEGVPASASRWLSLSYSTIAEILEEICEQQQSNIGDDIHVSIRHYIDLIQRHIMTESDIAQLCRKIYKQHRQAIDLIYEHRPDLRADIEEILRNLLKEHSESMKIERDESNQRWIRFAPQEWDELVFQKTCLGWTNSKRILLFEFWNEPQRLELRIVVGPGDLQVKKEIYEQIKSIPVPGVKKCRVSESSFNQLYAVSVLETIDYEDRSLEDIQDKLESFWENYSAGDMKLIRESIFLHFNTAN